MTTSFILGVVLGTIIVMLGIIITFLRKLLEVLRDIHHKVAQTGQSIESIRSSALALRGIDLYDRHVKENTARWNELAKKVAEFIAEKRKARMNRQQPPRPPIQGKEYPVVKHSQPTVNEDGSVTVTITYLKESYTT